MKAILNGLNCLQEGMTKKLFHLVVPYQVYIEFSRPGQFITTAIKDLEEQFQSWNAAVQAYDNICALPNLWPAKKHYDTFDIEKAKQLLGELVEISKQFLVQAIFVEPSLQAKEWAYHRETVRKRPARQGKDSFGDCVICGTSLSFLKTLREMQFSELAIFVSENKNDFAFDNGLHPELQAEFANVSLDYYQTIPKAFGEIWRQHAKAVRGQKV